MAYRETARTRAHTARRRSRIERAARLVIAESGFAGASTAAVAQAANCSTGLIYSYYANRDELLRTVFARAAGHELAAVESAMALCSTPVAIVDAVVEVFVRRAAAGRGLAHALLFEEVPATVQLERLALRRGYATAIAEALTRAGANASGHCGVELTAGRAEVCARFLVGGVAENLVDVLTREREAPTPAEIEALTASVSDIGRSALGATVRSAQGTAEGGADVNRMAHRIPGRAPTSTSPGGSQ